MQALTRPDSGGGHRGEAPARSKWRRIFYLLTAFNVVTISGALRGPEGQIFTCARPVVSGKSKLLTARLINSSMNSTA